MNKYFVIFAFALLTIACNNAPKEDKASTEEAKEVKSTEMAHELIADLEASTIKWHGTKPTGEHFGHVSLESGKVMINDGKITGGKFKIDLATIVSEDVEDADMNKKLVDHLKSEDFFYIEKYPLAKFEITSVEELTGQAMSHKVSGNLSMRDSVKNISFMANIDLHDGHVKVESEQFVLDRTEWGVNYGSKKIFANLKDKFIHDEMRLTVHLEAKGLADEHAHSVHDHDGHAH